MNEAHQHCFRRGSSASDASVTLGASQQPRQHVGPEPSYQTTTSIYSVATNLAIDHGGPQISPDAPPLPTIPLPRIVGDEPGTTRPIYDTVDNGARIPARKAVKSATGKGKGKGKEVAVQDLTLVSHAAAAATQQSPHDEAAAKLDGTWSGYTTGEKHSPPPFFPAEDFEDFQARQHAVHARKRAHNDRVRRADGMIAAGSIEAAQGSAGGAKAGRTAVRPIRSMKPATHARFPPEMRRALGPETAVNNVAQGDAVFLPEAAATPYASSSPKTPPPSLLRSFSKSAQSGLKRVASLARHHGSDARKLAVSGPADFRVDPGGYPAGAPAVTGAVPIAQAQRQRKTPTAAPPPPAPPPRSDPGQRYPNALPPRSKPSAERTPARTRPTAPATPPSPVRFQRSNTPAGRTVPPETPQAPRAVKVVGDPDRMTVFGDFVDYRSDGSAGSEESAVVVPRIDLATYRTPPPPSPPRDGRGRGRDGLGVGVSLGLATSAATTTTTSFASVSDSDSDDIIATPATLIRKIDRLDLSLPEKVYAATEAQRLQRRMQDRPPPDSAEDAADEGAPRPTIVVDTTVHAGHTSWRVTEDFPSAEVVRSWYGRVEVAREPDEAGRLMARLEGEREGRVWGKSEGVGG